MEDILSINWIGLGSPENENLQIDFIGLSTDELIFEQIKNGLTVKIV